MYLKLDLKCLFMSVEGHYSYYILKFIIIMMQVQNMNLKLNLKDINKILTKAHFKYNFFFKWCKETTHFCGNMSLWSCWKSPCHVFTSPSCSLREKSCPSLSVLWWALIICFIYLDTDINSSSVVHNPDIRFIPVWKIQFQLMSSVQRKAEISV